MEYNYAFLLIEDNVIDQIISSHILKMAFSSPKISIVNNGKEAIYWLKANREKLNKPLIILSDITMPVMDGFQFLAKYDKLPDEIKKGTQIFMLSSTLCIKEIKKGRNNPYVKDVLCKPLPIENFLGMIHPEHKHISTSSVFPN
ncbi:response regulator [Flavobacterium wongokense]|uniref:response regulator n=1 Tax=Flavobacterium wongokense TaxID=2910674 RepID=UPI001F34F243|nr:response regulator [Flavobacterium sp. WG47]MCF6133135.1 response regulator [Flavobacterium sp. WG47]